MKPVLWATAFYGASISRKFKVKEVRLHDATSIPYRTVFTSEKTGKDKVNNIDLYTPVKSKLAVKDERSSDMDLSFEYYDNEWVRFSEASVSGVDTSIEKVDKDLLVTNSPNVKVQIVFDEFGVPVPSRALAIFNSTNPEYESYLEELASWSEDIEKEKTESEESSSAEEEKKPLTPKPKEQLKYKIDRIPLIIKSTNVDKKSMDSVHIDRARKLFKLMDADDKQRKERATNINNLESLIYQVQELNYEEDFVKVTTQDERDELASKANDIS